MIENHGIKNLSIYSSNCYGSVVLSNFEVAFGEREDVAFCPLLYCVLLINNNVGLKKYVIKFPCFPYFSRYFVEACSFTAFNFFQYFVKFSPINCQSLMSIHFLVWLSLISGGFQSKFLKCSFHFWSLSSWLAAFSFGWEVLFFLVTLVTVCHTNHDCLIWNFCFYWFSLECIILFDMFYLVLSGLTQFQHIGVCLVSFI